jgi:hypothetical protein
VTEICPPDLDDLPAELSQLPRPLRVANSIAGRTMPLDALALDADLQLDMGQIEFGEQSALRIVNRPFLLELNAVCLEQLLGQPLEPTARQALSIALRQQAFDNIDAGRAVPSLKGLMKPTRRESFPQRRIQCLLGISCRGGDVDQRHRKDGHGNRVDDVSITLRQSPGPTHLDIGERQSRV